MSAAADDAPTAEGPALTVHMWADGVVEIAAHVRVSKTAAGAALIDIGTAMLAEAETEAAT